MNHQYRLVKYPSLINNNLVDAPEGLGSAGGAGFYLAWCPHPISCVCMYIYNSYYITIFHIPLSILSMLCFSLLSHLLLSSVSVPPQGIAKWLHPVLIWLTLMLILHNCLNLEEKTRWWQDVCNPIRSHMVPSLNLIVKKIKYQR